MLGIAGPARRQLARGEPIDRRVQPGTIGGELLRLLGRKRVDDGSHVGRPELVDHGPRDPARRCDLGRIHVDVEVVEEQHDDPFGVDVVGHDVGRDVTHPGRRIRSPVRQIDGLERHDRERLAAFEQGEVGRGQAAHRLAVAVEDGDVDRDDLDARSKRGLRRGSGRLGDRCCDPTRETAGNRHRPFHVPISVCLLVVSG